MKTDLYYFSGTGNSLHIARKIHDKLEGSSLTSIPHVLARKEAVRGDVIGIVCPIYMYNVPHIVAEFIGVIESAEYIFLVFAGAGQLGSGIKAVRKLFEAKSLVLSSLFNVPMPSNYTPFGGTPESRQMELFGNVDARVEEIAAVVRERGSFIDSTNTSVFSAYIHPGLLYRLGYSRINIMDKSFFADESCTGCGICGKVCPVDNITFENGRPVWNNRCQQCYACLQWCPVEAIQAGTKTAGVKRYHNPEVTVKDIINASAAEQQNA